MDGLEAEYAEQIVVQRINANLGQGPAIMQHYQLLGHPSLLFINAEGQEVSRLLGPQPLTIIRDQLKLILPDGEG